MKDYSMNLEEKKNFVLSYKIVEDTIDEVKDTIIIVKFATGEEWRIPYTEGNEKKILDKMKKQVEENSELVKKQENKRHLNIMTGIGFTFLIISSLILGNNNIGELDSIAYYISGGLSTIGLLNSICRVIKSNSLIADFNKNKHFVEIEEELNKKVSSNDNVLSKTSNRTRKMVEETLDNEPVFNINSFNYVPYSDIEQIMCNIKRDEEFGFDYDSEEVINASVKKKTRKM